MRLLWLALAATLADAAAEASAFSSGPSSRFWNMFGALPDNAPEWCKSEQALSWEEKRLRISQHAQLQWAKQTVKELRAKNETVPKWMDDMVTRDARQGQMKWAVKEAKRMKAEGQEVPGWMLSLVEEDNKWANRWAACKAAELEFAGEEAPQWMKENGRKGVLQAAQEKLAYLQEQIDELQALREKESAIVDAKGDTKLAERRLILAHRPSASQHPLNPSEPQKAKKGGSGPMLKLLKNLTGTIRTGGLAGKPSARHGALTKLTKLK